MCCEHFKPFFLSFVAFYLVFMEVCLKNKKITHGNGCELNLAKQMYDFESAILSINSDI